ncbi:MAG: hypothetical protein M1151_04485 [Candidatus Thermoplasmatota archaeon]|jgi:hypothetical protein|nr:hypothetical protein [Candidatus Thermoplasmatota archaeon]MCL5785912.1 hypothetical protein [Candidatus Thermoplasmatota archaeon]
MDCTTYVKRIIAKYQEMVKKYQSEESPDPAEEARSSSDFIDWMETVIKNGIVEEGDQTLQGKTCLLNYLNDNEDGPDVDDLYDALALFSDFRIKELLGVSIFSEQD